MLQIYIISIGKTNEDYVRQGISKYEKLLGKFCKLEWKELPDVKNGNKMDALKLRDAEAESIEAGLPDKCTVFFLDEKGKQFDSKGFAAYLDKKTHEHSKMAFVIGGAYGLSESIKKRGEAISLSEMTFNHQMVRVILAEQLFRAFTIIRGSTYHH